MRHLLPGRDEAVTQPLLDVLAFESGGRSELKALDSALGYFPVKKRSTTLRKCTNFGNRHEAAVIATGNMVVY
jgi:hypothetical protein